MGVSIALSSGRTKQWQYSRFFHGLINGLTASAMSHLNFLFVGGGNRDVIRASNKRPEAYTSVCCPAVMRHILQCTCLMYSTTVSYIWRVRLLGFQWAPRFKCWFAPVVINSGSQSSANADAGGGGENSKHLAYTRYILFVLHTFQ